MVSPRWFIHYILLCESWTHLWKISPSQNVLYRLLFLRNRFLWTETVYGLSYVLYLTRIKKTNNIYLYIYFKHRSLEHWVTRPKLKKLWTTLNDCKCRELILENEIWRQLQLYNMHHIEIKQWHTLYIVNSLYKEVEKEHLYKFVLKKKNPTSV